MFLVLNITPWNSVKAQVRGMDFPVDIPKSGQYYAPVYDNREDAARDYPNCQAVEVSFDKETSDE
jgi:hypothetical protein